MPRCYIEICTLGKQATLVRLATNGVEPRRIADSAVAIWFDVSTALTPVIGVRGVEALYRRSVNLVRADYPWLHAAYENGPDQGSFVVLYTALSEQSPTTAASANGALLEAFYQVLENLIGGPLTIRLLRSALDNGSADNAVKEIKS